MNHDLVGLELSADLHSPQHSIPCDDVGSLEVITWQVWISLFAQHQELQAQIGYESQIAI